VAERLEETSGSAEADAALRAIVIIGAETKFVARADIEQWERPGLTRIVERISSFESEVGER
jgi:enoyl-CoA hydratase/carnithine racemase